MRGLISDSQTVAFPFLGTDLCPTLGVGGAAQENTQAALWGLRLSETITLASVSPLQWKMNKLIGGVEGLPWAGS